MAEMPDLFDSANGLTLGGVWLAAARSLLAWKQGSLEDVTTLGLTFSSSHEI